jgi:hypothetical protein
MTGTTGTTAISVIYATAWLPTTATGNFMTSKEVCFRQGMEMTTLFLQTRESFFHTFLG